MGKTTKTNAAVENIIAKEEASVTPPPVAALPSEVPIAPPAAPSEAVKAVGVTMFKTPKGWGLIKMKLEITPTGPEILSWDTLGEEAVMPKNHAENYLKRFNMENFLMPD